MAGAREERLKDAEKDEHFQRIRRRRQVSSWRQRGVFLAGNRRSRLRTRRHRCCRFQGKARLPARSPRLHRLPTASGIWARRRFQTYRYRPRSNSPDEPAVRPGILPEATVPASEQSSLASHRGLPPRSAACSREVENDRVMASSRPPLERSRLPKRCDAFQGIAAEHFVLTFCCHSTVGTIPHSQR